MLKTVIIDDEKNSRELLRNFVENYCEDTQVIGEAQSIDEAKILLSGISTDLIFLDIEMKGGTGFDLLDALKDMEALICFVTGYDEYAIRAIKYGAFDYLLKPVSIEELKKLVERAKNHLSEKLEDDTKHLVIADGSKLNMIQYSEIDYLLADGNYIFVHLKSGKRHISGDSLSHFENILPKNMFVRTHKSYIVNLSAIKEVAFSRTGSILLKSGNELPVASRRKKEFIDSLNAFHGLQDTNITR